jgi:hypothetical protein
MFLYNAGSTEHRKNKIQQNAAMVVYKTQEKTKKMRERGVRTKSRE